MRNEFLQVHDLVLRLAPELAAEPLYITRLPPDYPQEPFHAFATRMPNSMLHDHLIATEQWQGPGAVIAIVDDSLDAESMTGLVLHEAAHLLPFQPAEYRDLSEPRRALESAMVAVAALMFERTPHRCEQHGPEFLRSCIHLQHRAAQIGIDIPYPAIVRGWFYCLPPLVQFAGALGDEPARMAGETFATIAATPAPAAFTSLFSGNP